VEGDVKSKVISQRKRAMPFFRVIEKCSGWVVQKHALSTEFVSLAENGMPAFENFFLKTGR